MSDAAQNSLYHYIPTRYVAIIFLCLYGVSTATHLAQAVYFRLWWIFPTIILAGLVELEGWSGRLWSSFSPDLIKPYQMQITGTILAPTPLIAANFIIMGHLTRYLGPVYSPLPPRWYSIVFLSCDIISLVIQGIGGGMASAATNQNKDPTPGGNVMLAGIAFQLSAMVFFALLSIEFIFRYAKDQPLKRRLPQNGEKYFRGSLTPRLKIVLSGLSLSTLFLLIRAIYRVIELADGWNGRIISTQVYFNVLDGTMVVLAFYTLNAAHPGLILRKNHRNEVQQNDSKETSSASTVV